MDTDWNINKLTVAFGNPDFRMGIVIHALNLNKSFNYSKFPY